MALGVLPAEMQVTLCFSWPRCKGVVRSMMWLHRAKRPLSPFSKFPKSKKPLSLPSTPSPQTQTPTLPGPLYPQSQPQPQPHSPPKVLLPTFETWRTEAPILAVCSALQHLFWAGVQQGARQPGLESQGGRKGSISFLPSVEGKWQEVGRSLLQDTLEPTGH